MQDCAGQSLAIGVEWASGANLNHVFASEWIACDYGYYVYKGTAPGAVPPDTPRVIGGRVEGCNIGILEAGQQGYYLIRFESSNTADIEWATDSSNAVFSEGCTTASSAIIHKNRNLATNPRILSVDLGLYDLLASTFLTVANLPVAGTAGRRAIVTDASVAYTSTNVGATVLGGGSNTAPVFDNGTNWVIG